MPEKQRSSDRPDTSELINHRKEKKEAEKQLRERQGTEGLKPLPRESIPNSKCASKTVEEEKAALTHELMGQDMSHVPTNPNFFLSQ